MDRKVVSIGAVVGMVWSLVLPTAQAAQWQLPLNPVCCSARHEVYGSEQPEWTDGVGGACVVDMDLALLDTGGANITDTSTTVHYDWPGGGLFRLFNFTVPKELRESINFIGLQLQKAQYHVYLNEVFRIALARVTGVKSEQEWQKLFAPKPVCNSQNFTTNCVAERLMCSYEKYQGVMFEMLRDKDLSHLTRTRTDLAIILADDMSFKKSVLEEANIVNKAFDTAIAVYQEVLESYRLHLQYKDIVSSLVKARSWTGYLRGLFACLPNKLLGKGTTKCE